LFFHLFSPCPFYFIIPLSCSLVNQIWLLDIYGTLFCALVFCCETLMILITVIIIYRCLRGLLFNYFSFFTVWQFQFGISVDIITNNPLLYFKAEGINYFL